MSNTSWSGNRRSFPTATRRLILNRHPTCVACHTRPSTVADHIIPTAEGGTDHPDNGQGLCNSCHDVKTRTEQARGRARKTRRRPPEPHPGHRPPNPGG